MLEFQAVQPALDRVILHVIPTSRYGPELEQRLRAQLEASLGPGVQVAVESVEQIVPESSGKRPLIKSALA